jgi:hypothetical protein
VTPVLGVHGVGNYRYRRNNRSDADAATAISEDWTAWLRAGLPPEVPLDLQVCYYAQHLYRGTPQGLDDPVALEPDAQDFLISWVEQLQLRPQIAQGPRTARARQAADWLTHRYGRTARLAAILFCQEAHTYLAHPDSPRRAAARETLATAIAERQPKAIIAHSLGSVLAYETLWSHPELHVDLLVTLGSPLGMSHVVFDRLQPTPTNGRGNRPPGVTRWANLSDVGDIIAIPSDLPQRFNGIDYHAADLTIGTWDFHTAKNYLASPATAGILFPHLSDHP